MRWDFGRLIAFRDVSRVNLRPFLFFGYRHYGKSCKYLCFVYIFEWPNRDIISKFGTFFVESSDAYLCLRQCQPNRPSVYR